MAKENSLVAAQFAMDRKQDIAVQALALAQKNVRAQQQRLEELQQYKTDYQKSLAQQGQQGIQGRSVREYHLFILRLEQGIEQQKSMIRQAEKQSELKQREWQMSYQKSKAVENLQFRLRRQNQLSQDRLEQKHQDEHAGRRHWQLTNKDS